MTNMVDKECLDTEWYTPESVLKPVRTFFQLVLGDAQIPLDPCTIFDNPTRARHHYTEWHPDKAHHDGLSKPWSPWRGVFMNPPFGTATKIWTEKARIESLHGQVQVVLLPVNRTEQQYFHDTVITDRLSAIVLVRKRVKFLKVVDAIPVPRTPRCKPVEARKCGNRWLIPHDSNPYSSWLFVYNAPAACVESAFSLLGKVIKVS